MSSVVISVDTELARGSHDSDTVPTDRVESAREGWRALVDLFETYETPATWAVVGHLFLSDCDGERADHPSVDGWFDADPGGPAAADEQWFAAGLVDAIRSSPVDHDIGGHLFSHRQLSPDLPEEIADAEIAETVAAAAECGFDLDSFVHPGNVVGHRASLAEHGFTCYRGHPPSRPYDGTAGELAWKLLSRTGLGTPRVVEPRVDEYGLVDVPASLYLFDIDRTPSRAMGSVGVDPVVSRARRGIDAALEADGIYHVWLHPNDLVTDHDVKRVEKVLEYAARVRSESELTVETMASVAARVRSKRPDIAPGR